MMLNLADAARAMAGMLAAEGCIGFERVTTDSRDVRPGDLFFALKGENFDGHDFVAQVLAQGAAAAVTSVPGDGARIVVKDTLLALGQLAAYWRQCFAALPLVAITGSNGKTTVKEMTAAILAAHAGVAAVHATRGNLNNHIGLPLTLLGINKQHRYVVAEMGMNHFGEIDYLTRLACPNVALITKAGSAHLEMMGSLEGVARAKGEIFAGLQANGCAIINLDDDFAGLWKTLAQSFRQHSFGLGDAEVSAHDIVQTPSGSRFLLSTPQGETSINLPAPGQHNVSNALAAVAAAQALDVPLSAIKAGLESYQGVKGRLQLKVAKNGATLIDDTYNANPDSMRAAIDVLSSYGGKTILVLGDMGEIGSDAPERHRDIGAYARDKHVASLFTLGEHMRQAAQAYGCPHFESLDDLLLALRRALTPDSTVLIKGSRFMQMERVVNALQEAV